MGIFFQALPDKTMCLKSEKCSGDKISKERLTVMLCVNMIGEFETPLIIGKAQRPRCFKGVNVNRMDIEWHSNHKAWMTQNLMTEWIGRLDRKMGRQKRNIILFLDNASSHPDIELETIKLVFFPPNTTSASQPLDQGVIKNFKVHYRQCVVRHLLANMETAKSASQLSVSINVLDAVLWISSSIKKIIPQTVRNCFLKAAFPCYETSNPTNTDTIENVAQLNELLRMYGEEASDYITIDENVSTEDQSTDVAELINSMQQSATLYPSDHSDGEEEGAGGEEEEQPPVNFSEAMEHAQQLKQFFLQKNDAEGLKMTSELLMHIETKISKIHNKQSTILDFFV